MSSESPPPRRTLVPRVDEHVVGALIPVLAEGANPYRRLRLGLLCHVRPCHFPLLCTNSLLDENVSMQGYLVFPLISRAGELAEVVVDSSAVNRRRKVIWTRSPILPIWVHVGHFCLELPSTVEVDYNGNGRW